MCFRWLLASSAPEGALTADFSRLGACKSKGASMAGNVLNTTPTKSDLERRSVTAVGRCTFVRIVGRHDLSVSWEKR